MKTALCILLASVCIFSAFFSGCTQQKPVNTLDQGLGREITHIGEAVPLGWNASIYTENLTGVQKPHGLWVPMAIVNFTNPSASFEATGGVHKHPSLWLYFYNISEKKEILGIIANESIYSWCIPIYFNETSKYIIITSPCYIDDGVFTEEAQAYYLPLEQSLKQYFHEFT